MRRQDCAGFTLMELLIAVSLSLIVLITVISVFTQMVSWHFDGTRKGKSLGVILYSLDQMYKELEDASVLIMPPPAGDVISGCSNWSDVIGGPIDPDTANHPIKAFY